MGVSRKFALGAVVGIAAGVIAGMLTAPKSGRDTRSDIRKKAADLKAETAGKVDHAMDKAEEYMHRAEDTIRDVKQDVVGKMKHDDTNGESSHDVTKKGFWDK